MKPFIYILITFSAFGFAPSLSADSFGSAWAVSFDNDFLAPSNSDRDFTGGLAITYTGHEGLKHWRNFDSALGRLDQFVLNKESPSSDSDFIPSIEWGVYGFTPDEIEAKDVLDNDRPYASLVYVTSSRIYPVQDSNNAWSSSLTMGVLGLKIMESAQNAIHSVVGTDQARGWDHQISDGGEPTFRYQLAYHQGWQSNTANMQFKTTYFGSVGYLTEAGIAISTRNGLIASSSHRFNPELITYGERVNELATIPSYGRENYFWGGVAIKARAYNAFLQGQFRYSEHRLESEEVEDIIAEAWFGYTYNLSNDFKLSYVLRAQSSEITSGKGDRAMVWGGIVISQTL